MSVAYGVRASHEFDGHVEPSLAHAYVDSARHKHLLPVLQ